MNGNRLYRSPTDRVLAGVAGGMAETYGLDPALVRVGWALLILITGGVFLVLYVIMAIVVPVRPEAVGLWSAGEPAAADPGSPAGATPEGATAPAYQPWPAHRRRSGDHSGALVIGFLLVLLGGFFLVRQFIPQINLGLIWPYVVIGAGLVLIVAAFARRGPQS